MENKLAEFQAKKKKAEKNILIGGIGLILAVLSFLLLQGNLIIISIILGITGIVFLIIGFISFSKLSKD